MNLNHWICTFALLLGCLPAGLAAEKPGELEAGFAEVLRKLDDDDYQVRQDATKALAELPGEAHALAKAALDRGNVGPEAKARLTEALPKLAMKARYLERVKEDAKRLPWFKKTLREAYEKVGMKDPKWDGPVGEALDLTAWMFSQPINLAGDEEDRILALCEKAYAAGCRDPMMLYVRAGMKSSVEGLSDQQTAKLHLEAAQGMKDTKYPPNRRAFAFERAAIYQWAAAGKKTEALKKQVLDLLELVRATLPELLRDPEVPEDQKISLLVDLIGLHAMVGGGHGAAYEKLRAEIEAALPQGSNVGLVIKGRVYVSWAWEARGGGYANKVTEDGWKKMRERLAVAKEALEEAYRINPRTPAAALAMSNVELGQNNGRESMENWWKHAMEAAPDSYEACARKLHYLEPKWHGSAEDMVAFGRECLETGNWGSRIPIILAEAHIRAAGYQEDSDAYIARPEVWKDIQSVYVPYLEAFPERHHDRCMYAKLACQAGQWKVADEQFNRLGNHARMIVFGKRQVYNQMRQQAAAKAGQEKAP